MEIKGSFGGAALSVTKDALMKAVRTLKESPKRGFLQSVELLMSLQDIDLRRPESRINELIELPHPISKPVKVCVFATGDLASRAKKGGADLVLGKSDIEELAKNRRSARKLAREYEHFLAEAPLMPLIGRSLGALLGPRGRMPIPVPPNAPIEDMIKRYKKMVRVRVRDQPAVKCRIATEDMEDEKIAENAMAVISAIEGKLEKRLKNVRSILLKKTMGPPVKILMKAR